MYGTEAWLNYAYSAKPSRQNVHIIETRGKN